MQTRRWRLVLGLLVGVALIGPVGEGRAAPSADAATDGLLALLPGGRTAIVALAGAVSGGDVAQAQAAYARARVAWETLEVALEGVPELEPFDTALDGREDDFPLGVNDPNWKGFHRIERALWRERTTSGLAPIAAQMVQDWDGFAAEFQRQVDAGKLSPAVLLDAAEDLLAEVATSKVSGEEERYSKLDLIDFQANLAGAQLVYDAYRDQIAARDSALAGAIAREFQDARASLAPYVRSEVDVANYDQVPQEARTRIAAAFRALARSLERAAQLF